MPKNICMLDEMGKNVKIRGFEDAILEDDIKKNTWQIDPSWCTAPELAAPHGYSMYDSRVDLWSLGCICYQLCTKNRPYVSEKNVYSETNYENDLDEISDMYSEELKKLIYDCLYKNYEKRPFIGEILERPEIAAKGGQLGLKVTLFNEVNADRRTKSLLYSEMI